MIPNADSQTVMNVAAELARKAHWADEYSEDLGNWMRYQSRRLVAALAPIPSYGTVQP